MDPLSITTAVLTLTALVSSTLRTAQAYKDVPAELRELANEVVDLGLVVEESARALESFPSTGISKDSDHSGPNSGEGDKISVLLVRCESKLQDLQALLQRTVLKETLDRPTQKLGPKARIIWMKE
jgi:hypothetical protein